MNTHSPSRKRQITTLGVCVGILLLAAVAVVGYFQTRSQPESSDSTARNDTTARKDLTDKSDTSDQIPDPTDISPKMVPTSSPYTNGDSPQPGWGTDSDPVFDWASRHGQLETLASQKLDYPNWPLSSGVVAGIPKDSLSTTAIQGLSGYYLTDTMSVQELGSQTLAPRAVGVRTMSVTFDGGGATFTIYLFDDNTLARDFVFHAPIPFNASSGPVLATASLVADAFAFGEKCVRDTSGSRVGIDDVFFYNHNVAVHGHLSANGSAESAAFISVLQDMSDAIAALPITTQPQFEAARPVLIMQLGSTTLYVMGDDGAETTLAYSFGDPATHKVIVDTLNLWSDGQQPPGAFGGVKEGQNFLKGYVVRDDLMVGTHTVEVTGIRY